MISLQTLFLWCLAVIHALAWTEAAVATSKLQILVPSGLRKVNGYDHRDAMFGVPPFGGSIQAQLYYADSDLCDAEKIDPTDGFPMRADGSAWQAPFVLMIDRGECTFVKKVRNAQRVGASAVLVADNVCLCHHDECQMEEDEHKQCEIREPIMADDGSGSDISIPSFLLFKEDADPIVSTLKSNQQVRVQMSFSIPNPDSLVEYDLWTSPADTISRDIQDTFEVAAEALQEHAKFTPHQYVYNGMAAGCHDESGEDLCLDLCTNKGRYCSVEVDQISGASGAAVVRESLRRICIWKDYGEEDGVGLPWWDYVSEFSKNCDTEPTGNVTKFEDKDCIHEAMIKAGIEKKKVDKCMKESGGTEGDNENELLALEVKQQEEQNVVMVPALYVNGAIIRGSNTFATAFKAVCAGFAQGSDPEICKMCSKCSDERLCVDQGRCPDGFVFTENVPLAELVIAVLATATVFGLIGFIIYRRQQQKMHEQIRGIVAEYMPVTAASNRVNNTSVAMDVDELDLDERFS